MSDPLIIAGREFGSRLFLGTAGYPNRKLMLDAIAASGTEMVTASIRRISLAGEDESLVDVIPKHVHLLPNTAGCQTAKDAVLTAELAREALETNWVKLEVIGDRELLYPDTEELVRATETLVGKGFTVLPYCTDDPVVCRKLADTGAAAVMPLGAPIGSGLGICNPHLIELICARSAVPVVLDARSRRRAIQSRWPGACAPLSRPVDWPDWPAAYPSLPMPSRRARNSVLSARSRACPCRGLPLMKLPDPPLLLITDRHQARLPLVDVVRAVLAAGCRWVSVREKDLPEEDQIALVLTLLPMVRRHGACLTLHGPAALSKACGSDGVHLAAGSNPAASRALLGPERLIGVSLHTVTEAEAIDPDVVDYAIAGPAFETPSKPGYGPEIGRKGLAEIARAARVPVLAIGGLNVSRAAEVMAAGPAGIAVMGGVMRATDPGQEMRALLAVVAGSLRA